MFDTLKRLWVPVLALGLGCFAGVGCIDNSGNKTYPHGDAASIADAGSDTVADVPEGDAPVADAPAGDAPTAGDVSGDHAPVDALLGDALTTDVRTDVAGN